ncbi:MAG: hypothetical protein ACKVOW_12110 [Chitinophagaceae bacterium]
MKKTFLALATSFSLVLLSCGNKEEKKSPDTTSTTPETAKPETTEPTAPGNQPKSYTVSFSPDTVYLGKNKEAFIKLKNAKAIELSDADGKITGIELNYDIELTNKSKLGASAITLDPGNFRLQLDNNNNITHERYNSFNTSPESTNSSTDNKFRLPAGTKPKALNLFLDETRVSVGVEIK